MRLRGGASLRQARTMRNYGAGANMGMDRPGANMGITAGHPSIMGRSDSAMDLQRYNSYFETRLVGPDFS